MTHDLASLTRSLAIGGFAPVCDHEDCDRVARVFMDGDLMCGLHARWGGGSGTRIVAPKPPAATSLEPEESSSPLTSVWAPGPFPHAEPSPAGPGPAVGASPGRSA